MAVVFSVSDDLYNLQLHSLSCGSIVSLHQARFFIKLFDIVAFYVGLAVFFLVDEKQDLFIEKDVLKKITRGDRS